MSDQQIPFLRLFLRWWMIVVLAPMLLAWFGCSDRIPRTIGLIDQIPEGEAAGPWRIVGFIPKRNALLEHLESYRAVGVIRQEGALFQTDTVSSFGFEANIRAGERLLAAVRYRKAWGEGRTLSMRIGGHGLWQSVLVPLGRQTVIAHLGAAERDSRLVQFVHRLRDPAEIPFESMIAIAVEPGAGKREIKRALTLLRLWAANPFSITEAVLQARRIPFSFDGSTRESIMLLPDDTLSFDVPDGLDGASIALWPQGLREGSGLVLDAEASGRWQRLHSWPAGKVPRGSWAELRTDVPLPPSSKSIRFILSNSTSNSAVSIGEPVIKGMGRGKKRYPNLIVIDFDTMRSDRLGCYGYTTRPTSVTLDSLLEAKAFFVFENAYSPSSWTLPATARILTSRYLSVQDGAANGFSRSHTTLAEFLRQNGYYCAAFTGGGMLRMPGFEQGFHEFHWTDQMGKAEESFPDGSRWLQTQQTEPFFLFLHTFETHWPLIRDTFCKNLPRGRLGDLSRGESLLPQEITHKSRLTRAESLYVEAAYDGGVYTACEALVDLFSVMDARELWRNTVVVVLSDHGEEFWDHFDVFSTHKHSSLYGELINVAFFMYSPWLHGTPQSVEVSTIDLVPTLVDLLGIDAQSKWDGVSLVPCMMRKPVDRSSPILSFTTPEEPAQQPRVCVIKNGVKYIDPIGSPVEGATRWERHIYLPKERELFFLKDDPFERYNRIEDEPDYADTMSMLLRNGIARVINSSGPTFQPSPRGIPSDLEKQLRALGYLEVD